MGPISRYSPQFNLLSIILQFHAIVAQAVNERVVLAEMLSSIAAHCANVGKRRNVNMHNRYPIKIQHSKIHTYVLVVNVIAEIFINKFIPHPYSMETVLKSNVTIGK